MIRCINGKIEDEVVCTIEVYKENYILNGKTYPFKEQVNLDNYLHINLCEIGEFKKVLIVSHTDEDVMIVGMNIKGKVVIHANGGIYLNNCNTTLCELHADFIEITGGNHGILEVFNGVYFESQNSVIYSLSFPRGLVVDVIILSNTTIRKVYGGLIKKLLVRPQQNKINSISTLTAFVYKFLCNDDNFTITENILSYKYFVDKPLVIEYFLMEII